MAFSCIQFDEKTAITLSAIWQRDTVELRLVCERMLRFNNRGKGKFKTFKAEKGESWKLRWASWEDLHTLLYAESQLRASCCFSVSAASCFCYSWVAQPERNGTLHFNGLTVAVWPMLRIQTSKDWETFSRVCYRAEYACCPTGSMSGNFPCCIFSSLEGDESSLSHRSKVKALWL